MDRRRWRDAVRRHFTGAQQRQVAESRRQKARKSGRPHPIKWFDFPDSNQETRDVDSDRGGNNGADDGRAAPLAQARRLEQLLGEMRQLVRAEIGQSFDRSQQATGGSLKRTDGRSGGNNDENDDRDGDEAATMTVSAFLDDMTRLLDACAQCQQHVDVLKRQLRRLARFLGSLPMPKQQLSPSSASVSADTVSAMTDEEFGSFTLGHQEALLRAALADGESQVAERLQLRLHHFQQAAAAVNAPPPEVFLTRDQYAACRSARGRRRRSLVAVPVRHATPVSRIDQQHTHGHAHGVATRSLYY